MEHDDLIEIGEGGADVPAAVVRFTFEGEQAFKLADPEEGKKRRKFEIVANSGKPFFHPWWGNFAVDFEGLEIPKQQMGVLESHDSRARIGVTAEIDKDDKRGLVARGLFLTNQNAQSVIEDHDEGFPFEASVFVPPTRIEFVEVGAEAEVNGHKLTGPGHIFRASTLREITVAAVGADHQTSAVALTSEGPTVHVPEPEGERTMAKKDETTPPAKLSAEDILKAHPEAAQEIRGAAFKAGQEAERKRATEILEAAKDRQISKATELVRKGCSLVDALKDLLEDDSSYRKDRLSEIRDANDNDSTVPDGDETGDTPRRTPAASLTLEEQAALDYSTDAGIRAEFDSEASYLAFLKADAGGLILRPGNRDE